MKRFFLAAESKSNRHRGACRGTCTRHRHKRRAQHRSQTLCCCHRAVEDAIQHVYDCTVRETPHFPIYSTPPCTQGLSPNRKMRFPARFFRVGSWNFDTWFACEFQACPKLSILGKMLWHFLQKSNPRICMYRDSSRDKKKSKRLSFGHTCNTYLVCGLRVKILTSNSKKTRGKSHSAILGVSWLAQLVLFFRSSVTTIKCFILYLVHE